jgi:hypothetical protein
LHEIQVCCECVNIGRISESSPPPHQLWSMGMNDSTETINQCIKSNWIHFMVDSKLVSSSQCCHRNAGKFSPHFRSGDSE